MSRSLGRASKRLLLASCIGVSLVLGAFTADAAGPADQLALAAAELEQGKGREGRARLEVLLAGLPATATAAERVPVLTMLGEALAGSGQEERGVALLEEATALAEQAGLEALRAQALNGLGNAVGWKRPFADGVDTRSPEARALADERRRANARAQAAHQQSATLAEKLGMAGLALRATINLTRFPVNDYDGEGAMAALERAEQAYGALPAGESDPLARLAMAALALQIAETEPAALPLAERMVDAAEAVARDERQRSWASGYRGELATLQQREEEALRHLRRAAILAEAAGAPEIRYRWQWRIGRILARRGQVAPAIAAYRSAVGSLELVRTELPTFDPRTGRSLYRETLGPIFVELADLLLQQAAKEGVAGAQAVLVDARLAVERAKIVELADYFQDDCTAALQAKVKALDAPGKNTAVFYPVPLQDRTELILALPDGRLASVATPYGQTVLAQLAARVRRAIELEEGDHLRPAQLMFELLIRPLEPLLQENEVRRLIYVPDATLRAVPLAALHDGERYLIERFELATGVGLSLLETAGRQSTKPSMLIAGLSRSVLGYRPLPKVPDEVAGLSAIAGTSRTLLDETFTAAAVQQSLAVAPVDYIHLASHGEFSSDPKKSFILTIDGRLDLESLERLVQRSGFRKQPISLLTLSACNTATGDDRATLGLAGLATRVGARSAIGALWQIDDDATGRLMVDFYSQLFVPGTPKSEALRQAQLGFIKGKGNNDYRHPYFWSPFLLVGNWQ